MGTACSGAEEHVRAVRPANDCTRLEARAADYPGTDDHLTELGHDRIAEHHASPIEHIQLDHDRRPPVSSDELDVDVYEHSVAVHHLLALDRAVTRCRGR